MLGTDARIVPPGTDTAARPGPRGELSGWRGRIDAVAATRTGAGRSANPGPASPGPRLVRAPDAATPSRHWSAPARRVLEHADGPLRVLGGPGTGKTTLLLEVVARRIREGVPPENVLLLVLSLIHI